MTKWMLATVLMVACGGGADDAGAVDPMVGEWQVVELTIERTFDMPRESQGETWSIEFDLTDEPRGRVFDIATYDDGGERRDRYDLSIDVFDEGEWTLENEDGGFDFVFDCTAAGDRMTCDGGFDGDRGQSMVLERR